MTNKPWHDVMMLVKWHDDKICIPMRILESTQVYPFEILEKNRDMYATYN